MLPILPDKTTQSPSLTDSTTTKFRDKQFSKTVPQEKLQKNKSSQIGKMFFEGKLDILPHSSPSFSRKVINNSLSQTNTKHFINNCVFHKYIAILQVINGTPHTAPLSTYCRQISTI